ncbi:meiosis-specific protein MEI4 isoform X2 [Labeo rohita]|uniref:meiosis-specific protein MEI4 isoform X2 n=1 Tax=Labeo rohita TaxID=84645 RepID=UPI0021E22960|nr:meiosis-specific protein MEI4 isoform X2 [Labeo rohita]
MEEKSSSGYEGAVSWYMSLSKLALAVAIIKIRPSGGARQFAESLADRLRQQDESWRSEVKSLHEDLLRLRQELLLTRLLFKTKTNAGPRHGQDTARVLSQEDPQQLKSDSGCDTDNSSQTQIYGAQGPCLPPTPPNSQNVSLLDRKWRQDHRLLKHMQFLHCLSGLRRGYEPSMCHDGDVVWDSVVQLLDSVVEVFRQIHVGQPLHHPEQLRHATQVVAQTLSRGATQNGCSVQHFSKVNDLLKEMIGLLLTNQQLNSCSVHGVLSECLLALGGSPVVRTALVQLLMSQIIQLAQQLWDTCKRSREEQHHQVDWICYENSFYVFWLLEHLAQDSDYDVNQELVIQLETKAFPLADEFPLFSLYMWRIGGLFRAGHT